VYIFVALVNIIFVVVAISISRRVFNAVSLLIAPQIALDMIGGYIYELKMGRVTSDGSVIIVLALVTLANFSFAFKYCLTLGSRRSSFFKLIEENKRYKDTRVRIVLGINLLVILTLIFNLLQKSGAEIFTRQLYEITREGFGHIYFSCLFLCYTGVAISLCNTNGVARWLWVVTFSISSASLGAKTPMVVAVYISLIYYSVRRIKSIKGLLVWMSLSLLGATLAILSFYIYSEWARDNMVLAMVSYSDGIRNFAGLIDKWTDFKLGVYWFEDNVFGCIPRSLFPGKPLVYGSGNLAPLIFISETIDKGTPSFTRYGRIWADFGYGSFLIIPIMCGINGVFAAKFEDSLERRPTFAGLSGFFLSIGLPFFNIGSVFLSTIFANILLSMLVWFLLIGRNGDCIKHKPQSKGLNN